MKKVKISGNQEKIIEIIEKALRKGEILILPTDTVYGLVADARHERVVKKIFRIKKRPFSKPLLLFVKDTEMAQKFAEVNQFQEKFLRKFWPGKVTFILKRKGNLPAILFAGKKTIGLRASNYKLIRDLFEKIDFPLVQTSANLSANPAPTKAEEILEQFKDQKLKPDLIVDVGDLGQVKPSTIVDLSGDKPVVLRQGEVFLNL